MNGNQAETVLSLNNISRSFQQGGKIQPVLENVCCEINHGETVALLGRSGCGKSTLLNIIGGIDLPNQGSVIIDNSDLTAMDEHTRTLFRRTHIGIVYQFFNLLTTINVEDNLLLPLELNGWDVERSKKRVEELLQAVELKHLRASFPEQLSGGEQQRIAVARALAHRPKLILADEPTGNLDAKSGRQTLILLHELVEEEGSTMLVVTHSQAVAARADRTLILESGTLKGSGERILW